MKKRKIQQHALSFSCRALIVRHLFKKKKKKMTDKKINHVSQRSKYARPRQESNLRLQFC